MRSFSKVKYTIISVLLTFKCWEIGETNGKGMEMEIIFRTIALHFFSIPFISLLQNKPLLSSFILQFGFVLFPV